MEHLEQNEKTCNNVKLHTNLRAYDIDKWQKFGLIRNKEPSKFFRVVKMQ